MVLLEVGVKGFSADIQTEKQDQGKYRDESVS